MQQINSVSSRTGNIDAIYWFIHARKSVAIREISHNLGLSLPTVNQHLQQLQGIGLISNAGMMESTGGRKARAYSVDKASWVTLGLDITRRAASVVGVDLGGQVLFRHSRRVPFENDAAYYQGLGRLVAETLSSEGVAEARVLGAGISLPAILSEDGECAVNSVPLGQMRILRTAFEEWLPFPCSLYNDASAGGYAAFQAHNFASQERQDCLAYLSVSDTVGGSIMIDGRMYPGLRQHSAEFGHMKLYPGGERCYCGQLGCANVYINTRCLSDFAGGELDDFFAGLAMGDARYAAYWNQYLDRLAIAIGNIWAALDCEVIIGGYLGRYIAPYLADLRVRLGQLNMFEKNGSYAMAYTHIEEISAVGAALRHQHRAVRDMIASVPEVAGRASAGR